MEFKKDEIPYLYLLIYSRLKKHLKKNRFVRPKTIKYGIKMTLKDVPNYLLYPIMCQMEEKGLIKKKHQQLYEILKTDKDKILEELRHFTFW